MQGLALLVDGDQVSPDVVLNVLKRVEKSKKLRQRICVRNWRSTKDQQAWNQFALEHSFDCRQSNPKTTGKNASDIELTVIGMELLALGVQDFVVLTGDSDFQPLVAALTRGGAHVDWIDPSKMQPKPSQKASRQKPAGRSSIPPPDKATQQKRQRYLKGMRRVIGEIVKDGNHEKGWVHVSVVGTQLRASGLEREGSGFPARWPMRKILENEGFKLKKQETGQFMVSIS